MIVSFRKLTQNLETSRRSPDYDVISWVIVILASSEGV